MSTDDNTFSCLDELYRKNWMSAALRQAGQYKIAPRPMAASPCHKKPLVSKSDRAVCQCGGKNHSAIPPLMLLGCNAARRFRWALWEKVPFTGPHLTSITGPVSFSRIKWRDPICATSHSLGVSNRTPFQATSFQFSVNFLSTDPVISFTNEPYYLDLIAPRVIE